MRIGDKARAIQAALLGGLAPGEVFGLLARVTDRGPSLLDGVLGHTETRDVFAQVA